jgi:hypothetical protein
MSSREYDRHLAAQRVQPTAGAAASAPDGGGGNSLSATLPHDEPPPRFTRRIDCAEPSEKPAPPRVARGRRSRSD